MSILLEQETEIILLKQRIKGLEAFIKTELVGFKDKEIREESRKLLVLLEKEIKRPYFVNGATAEEQEQAWQYYKRKNGITHLFN